MHREHPASEVIVTGTFDNWAQTEKLHKKGDIFEKEVTLPSAADKIYYKVRKGNSCGAPALCAIGQNTKHEIAPPLLQVV